MLEPLPTIRDKLVNGSPCPYLMVSHKLIRAANIDVGARWLYIVLQLHFRTTSDGPDADAGFPPMEMLCANLDASERTIRRWLNVLISTGLIESEQRSETQTLYLMADPEDVLERASDDE